MERDNAKANFIFQMLYQIVTLAIPLIIAPHLTRTLGDSSLGIYTYTYSIVYCFMSIARLGIDKYGQRMIASVRDNELKLRLTFWSLYVVHIFFTLVALILYLSFVLLHIAKLNGRLCGAKRPHSVSEQPNFYQSLQSNPYNDSSHPSGGE